MFPRVAQITRPSASRASSAQHSRREFRHNISAPAVRDQTFTQSPTNRRSSRKFIICTGSSGATSAPSRTRTGSFGTSAPAVRPFGCILRNICTGEFCATSALASSGATLGEFLAQQHSPTFALRVPAQHSHRRVRTQLRTGEFFATSSYRSELRNIAPASLGATFAHGEFLRNIRQHSPASSCGTSALEFGSAPAVPWQYLAPFWHQLRLPRNIRTGEFGRPPAPYPATSAPRVRTQLSHRRVRAQCA
ncbi:hypothetical protein AVEN_272959-1 [Araneus ventricosus]|uniref:Uncharacterized protein n=1 Tax=Araneus ventricosus TaxID=182803 RepID=A0A4Y2AIC0_ARAVE|nr:hypothetical protein AVEN_272959-1 [Araneus ventricosus]